MINLIYLTIFLFFIFNNILIFNNTNILIMQYFVVILAKR